MDLIEIIDKFESDRPMLYGLLKEQVGTSGIESLFIYLINTLDQQQVSVEPEVKPVDYGTCKNCIFNLEQSETSLVSECQLTVDEFTGIGVMFGRDFGCNQWQSKPSV